MSVSPRTLQIADAAYRTILIHTPVHSAKTFEIRASRHSNTVFALYLHGTHSFGYEVSDPTDETCASEHADVIPIVTARLKSMGLTHKEGFGAWFMFSRIKLEPLEHAASAAAAAAAAAANDGAAAYFYKALHEYSRTTPTPSELQIAASGFLDHPPGKVALMKNIPTGTWPNPTCSAGSSSSSSSSAATAASSAPSSTLAVTPTTVTAIESTVPTESSAPTESVDAAVNTFTASILNDRWRFRFDRSLLFRVVVSSCGSILEVTSGNHDTWQFPFERTNLHCADVIIRRLYARLEVHGYIMRRFTYEDEASVVTGAASAASVSGSTASTTDAAAAAAVQLPTTTTTADMAPPVVTPTVLRLCRPTTPDEFFHAVSLTHEQKENVLLQFPQPSMANLFLLCCMDIHLLEQCKLMPVQINAWKRIADELMP